MLDTCPHGVFPSRILVWIEVFVYRSVWFLDFCMSGTVETHVEVLGEIPAYGEFPVPEELLAECQRQLTVLQTLHIPLLQLIIVSEHLGVEGDVLRQPVQTEALQYVIPFAAALDFLERFECLVYRRVAVVNRTAPVVLVLINRSLAACMPVAVAVAEREVCRVVRHRMLLRGYAHLHVGQ